MSVIWSRKLHHVHFKTLLPSVCVAETGLFYTPVRFCAVTMKLEISLYEVHVSLMRQTETELFFGDAWNSTCVRICDVTLELKISLYQTSRICDEGVGNCTMCILRLFSRLSV